MKKTIIMVLFLIFVASCSTTTTTPSTISGERGLSFNFVEGKPPTSIFKNNFEVELEYINNGEEDISNSVFFLTGFDDYIFPGLSSSKGGVFMESINSPVGKNLNSALWSSSINRGNAIEGFSNTIKAIACYSYTSKAQAAICVQPPASDTNVNCQNGESSGLTNQKNAPVTISSIQVSPDDSELIITLANSGGGKTFLGGLNSCLQLTKDDENKVTVSASLPNQNLNCVPSTIDLDLKNQVYCALPGNFEEGITTNVVVSVNYNYKKEKSKNIFVEVKKR